MVDWRSVVLAIRGKGYSLEEIADRLDEHGVTLGYQRLSELCRKRNPARRVLFETGDGLLDVLKEVDEKAWWELYGRRKKK